MAPTKGIAPGCPIATALVKLYYMDAIEEWQQQNAKRAGQNRITVDVYIDDFIVTIRGNNPDSVVHVSISAMWELEVMVQQRIGASLVAKKARVTANDDRIARRIAKAMGMQIEGIKQIEALGVDIGAGKARREWKNQTIDNRIKKTNTEYRRSPRLRGGLEARQAELPRQVISLP